MFRGKVFKTDLNRHVEPRTGDQSGLEKCLKSVKTRKNRLEIEIRRHIQFKPCLGGGGVFISQLVRVWGIFAPSQQYRNPQILNSIAPCKPECQASNSGFH